MAVNEETENPKTTPGVAAVASTFLLVAVYVLVSAAALSFAGPNALSRSTENGADDIFALIGESVLGPWLDRLLVLAVLTSAAAATQTTILPAARTALSMASAGAFPARFAEIHPRYKSPGFATLMMGVVSIVWFVFLRSFSKNVLDDSIEALGLCVAFYYALTGFACVIIYRKDLLKSARNFMLMGLLPAVGAVTMVFLLVESAISLAHKAGASAFGIGLPLAIAAVSLSTVSSRCWRRGRHCPPSSNARLFQPLKFQGERPARLALAKVRAQKGPLRRNVVLTVTLRNLSVLAITSLLAATVAAVGSPIWRPCRHQPPIKQRSPPHQARRRRRRRIRRPPRTKFSTRALGLLPAAIAVFTPPSTTTSQARR